MTLVVSDNDEVGVVLSEAETFITPVATNIKSNFTLRDATRCRRDAYSSNLPSKLSLVRARSFVYLYKHIGLVVRVSEGNFGFIMGMVLLWLITAAGHDPSSSLNSDIEGKRGKVEKTILRRKSWVFSEVPPERMAAFTITINDSLISVGIDAFVGLLTEEKVGNKFDDKRIRVEPQTKTNFYWRSICRS